MGSLKEDWENEYKPLLDKVTTPKEVEDATRLGGISIMASSDDYDEIIVESKMAAIRRIGQYERVIQSLYCQFIQKIATEVDRYTLIFMIECGWKGNDFKMDNFLSFSDGLLKQKGEKAFEKLSKYNSYNLLHKINNFLKHNSIESYKKLQKYFPNNVASVENGHAKKPYENGMFAGDWIIVKRDYIDQLLNKLVIFFEDYCRVFLHEDIERSKWDYDDYFYNAHRQMKYPSHYLGLDF